MNKKELARREAAAIENAQRTGKSRSCAEHGIRGCNACANGVDTIVLSTRARSRMAAAQAQGDPESRADKSNRSSYPTCPGCGVKYRPFPGADSCGMCGEPL